MKRDNYIANGILYQILGFAIQIVIALIFLIKYGWFNQNYSLPDAIVKVGLQLIGEFLVFRGFIYFFQAILL